MQCTCSLELGAYDKFKPQVSNLGKPSQLIIAAKQRTHTTYRKPRNKGMTGDQSTGEVREASQLSTLHFVDVAVNSSGAAPARKPDQERGIRAHVMRNYIQKKAKSSKSRNTSSALSTLSDHINRFRLTSRRDRKRSRYVSRRLDFNKRTSTLKPIVPKSHQSLHQIVVARPLANNTLSAVPSPIDTSTPGTLSLLEYYHTSFWDNSLACNPEGKWLSVAVSDSAVLHATLSLVAIHKFQTRGGPQTNSYLWHRGAAMRLVSKNLADLAHATSDGTIAAVSILSSSDNRVSLHEYSF